MKHKFNNKTKSKDKNITRVEDMDRTTIIRNFHYNDKYYYHVLNLDNDAVYLVDLEDEDTNFILCYDSSTNITNIAGDRIGKIRIVNNTWAFFPYGKNGIEEVNNSIIGHSFNEVEGHLDTEVLVSIWYLSTLVNKDAE